MPMIPDFDTAIRKRRMGPKLPTMTLLSRSRVLLDGLGETYQMDEPDTSYVSTDRKLLFLEEALHELAHHISLVPSDTFFSMYRGQGKTIGKEISNLSPMMSDGNELDALAVELNAAWWLQVPLRERMLVGVAVGNLKFFPVRAALRTVRELRRTPACFKMGFDLACAIKNAKEL